MGSENDKLENVYQTSLVCIKNTTQKHSNIILVPFEFSLCLSMLKCVHLNPTSAPNMSVGPKRIVSLACKNGQKVNWGQDLPILKRFETHKSPF